MKDRGVRKGKISAVVNMGDAVPYNPNLVFMEVHKKKNYSRRNRVQMKAP